MPRKGDNAPMAIIELTRALSDTEAAEGKAEEAKPAETASEEAAKA